MTEPVPFNTLNPEHAHAIHVAYDPLLTYTRRPFAYEVRSEQCWGDGAEEMSWSVDASATIAAFRQDFRAHAGAAPAMVTVSVAKSTAACARDLPPGCIVLLHRFAGDEVCSGTLLDHCKALVKEGFTIGIANYAFEPYWAPILSLLSYIRIGNSRTLNANQKAFLAGPYRRQIRFIAQNIQDETDLQWAMNAGYQLFQGKFFTRPARRKPPEAWFKERFLLLQRACDYPCERTEFIRDIMDYPDILAKLKHALNVFSADEVHTVEAMETLSGWLGDGLFARLAQYVLVQELCGQSCRDLLLHCFRRARFFSLAAPYAGLDPRETYFSGLIEFCLPDTQEAANRTTVAEPVSMYIRRTLGLGAPGRKHQALEALVDSYDSADWSKVRQLCSESAMDDAEAADLYRAASRWSVDLVDLRDTMED